MNAPVVIVGSGPSGVHFAQTVLEAGQEVVLVDVGRQGLAAELPGSSLNDLKETLPDPVRYFLGNNYNSLIMPGSDGEYYGFPPNKRHIFETHPRFGYRLNGFSPLVSFAAGGLAEAWTGGSYPFNEQELADFPFSYKDLEPYYTEAAGRIGVTGERDDLAAFFPFHGELQPPLRLDEHSAQLLTKYRDQRETLNREMGFFMGRSRSAVLSQPLNGRMPCDYSGRCLWGCPSLSLYTPSVTLRECQRHPGFRYLRGLYADHFRFTASGKIRSLVAYAEDGTENEIPVGKLVLAAGALSSARIFLMSIYRDSGQRIRLKGLMDNRQVLMPFLNFGMLGKAFDDRTFQYHQLAIGMPAPAGYVHGLITTLKTALIHPVVQNLPFDLGMATSVFRNIHAALGLVNINFADFRRDSNYVELDGENLSICYQPDAGEPARIAAAEKKFRSFLWACGCVAPKPMTHLRPMGASVHYAGMIPMTARPEPLQCLPSCQSADFDNLLFADGITFPALPAKNLTFTLMANAIRVARQMLG